MPRKLRLEYAGAIYHVMSRGDQREDIFLDDVDRHDFIKTLAEACQKTDWQVHAFCLMRNHYHLVLETPNANLVRGMAWLMESSPAVRRSNWAYKPAPLGTARDGFGTVPQMQNRRVYRACGRGHGRGLWEGSGRRNAPS